MKTKRISHKFATKNQLKIEINFIRNNESTLFLKNVQESVSKIAALPGEGPEIGFIVGPGIP